MKDFLEWSLLRNWVKSWLSYCQWYYGIALQPDVPLQEFFNAPIVNTKWNIPSEDPNLVRYGLIWKIVDLVALKGVDYQLPILTDQT
jgi:hypothetical protein